jgi:integrase
MSAGSIRRRGARSWELKYDIGRSGGRRQTRYRSFKGTRRQAEAELARLLAQVADGRHVDPSRLAVAEFVASRLTLWRTTGAISPKTAQTYRTLLDYQITPFLGGKLIQKLTTRDIEDWHATLQESGRRDGKGGVSPRTIQHAHRLLGKVLREAMRHDLLVRNVVTLQRAPRVSRRPMRILTAEQIRTLPARLQGNPLEALALVALFSGMRRGELLALNWSNVDLEAGIIRVRMSLEETRIGLRIKPPKSKAGIRDVTLPAIVGEVLRQHRRRLLEHRLMLGLGKLNDEALVFPRWDGSLQSPDGVSATWANAARKLGLAVSFHELRHTHASWLINTKVDVTTIAHRLGHSSPAITLAVYAHLFQKDDREAAAAIDAALRRLESER